MIGIYKITNLINDKIYIGQSIDIKRRWRQHRQMNGTNPMYKDMKIYGLKNFKFEIIEECEEKELTEKEIYWINYYNSINNGYNLIYPNETTNSVSNQLIVTINKRTYNDEENFYMNTNSIRQAARELSPSGLKFYIYLSYKLWQDFFEPNYIPIEFKNMFEISDSSYNRAKAELINKKYIKIINDKIHFCPSKWEN